MKELRWIGFVSDSICDKIVAGKIDREHGYQVLEQLELLEKLLKMYSNE